MPRILIAATRMPILLLSLALLAACASQPPAYSKPGVAAADQKRDESECLRASLGNNQRRLLLYQIDRAAYAGCMEARGYTLQQ